MGTNRTKPGTKEAATSQEMLRLQQAAEKPGVYQIGYGANVPQEVLSAAGVIPMAITEAHTAHAKMMASQALAEQQRRISQDYNGGNLNYPWLNAANKLPLPHQFSPQTRSIPGR